MSVSIKIDTGDEEIDVALAKVNIAILEARQLAQTNGFGLGYLQSEIESMCNSHNWYSSSINC